MWKPQCTSLGNENIMMFEIPVLSALSLAKEWYPFFLIAPLWSLLPKSPSSSLWKPDSGTELPGLLYWSQSLVKKKKKIETDALAFSE